MKTTPSAAFRLPLSAPFHLTKTPALETGQHTHPQSPSYDNVDDPVVRQRIKKKNRKTPEQLFESLVDDWTEFDLWAKSEWDESDHNFRHEYHARFRTCLKQLQQLLPDVDPQKVDPDSSDWFHLSIQEQSLCDLLEELDRTGKTPTSAQFEELSHCIETLHDIHSSLREKASALLIKHGQLPPLPLSVHSCRQLVDELENRGNVPKPFELDQLARLLDSVDKIQGWLRQRGNAILLRHGRDASSEPLPMLVYCELVEKLQKPRSVPSAYELDELSRLLGSLKLEPWVRAQGTAILAKYGRAKGRQSEEHLAGRE